MNNILSNSMTIVCAVIVLTTIVTIGINIGIPALKNRGIDVKKYIDGADTVIEKANTIIEATDSILPNNPIVNTIKVVEKWAKIGVDYAEQLYNTSKIEKDGRNDKAKEQVYTALKLLGLEITPDIDKIIDGTIEAEVLALGHTPVDIKQYKEVQQQLQTQNDQLQQENAQFKQVINSVQTTVQVVTQ